MNDITQIRVYRKDANWLKKRAVGKGEVRDEFKRMVKVVVKCKCSK